MVDKFMDKRRQRSETEKPRIYDTNKWKTDIKD